MRKYEDPETSSRPRKLLRMRSVPEAWRLGSGLGPPSRITSGNSLAGREFTKKPPCSSGGLKVLCGWRLRSLVIGLLILVALPPECEPMRNEALIFGLVLLIFGVLLLYWAIRARKIRGLGPGKTLALDDLVLYSERLKIVGRPDRIVRQGDFLISEEWKPSAEADLSRPPSSSRRLLPAHRREIRGKAPAWRGRLSRVEGVSRSISPTSCGLKIC